MPTSGTAITPRTSRSEPTIVSVRPVTVTADSPEPIVPPVIMVMTPEKNVVILVIRAAIKKLLSM